VIMNKEKEKKKNWSKSRFTNKDTYR